MHPGRIKYEHQTWSEATAFDKLYASIQAPDGDRFRAACSAFKRLQCWPVVWERLSRLPDVEDSFRENFHARIVESGFHFRESVQDQTMVIRAFRDLLPPYSGPSQKLYRGEIASKHERRDYGFSWTPLLRVAQRLFVERRQILNGEPGILLETIAPPEAIIAAPHPHSIYIGEYEYIVDPAALQEIRVIE
jgi:hypothetical protein